MRPSIQNFIVKIPDCVCNLASHLIFIVPLLLSLTSLVLHLHTSPALAEDQVSSNHSSLPNRDTNNLGEQQVGAIYSLSGWGKQGGEKELAGLSFAIDEINQRGGLLGKRIKLKVEDNASDLKTTVTATQRLTKIERVPVIFGPNYAEFSEVVAPIAQREQTLMISSSGYTKSLTRNRPYVFTTLPAHKLLTASLTEYIRGQTPNSIAIFKTNSAYLDSVAESFIEQLQPTKISVFNFNPGETDFKSSILKAKHSKVESIVISIIQGDISAFLRQIRDLKVESKLYSTNSILFDDGIKMEPKLANGVILYDYSVAIPEGPRNRFLERFGYEPKDNVARTYAAFEAWSQSVLRCGSFNPSIVKGCLTKGVFDTVVGPLEFDNTNNVIPHGRIVNLLKFEEGILKDL